jgi:hypothetical protein
LGSTEVDQTRTNGQPMKMPEHYQFADLAWQSRWNKSTTPRMYHQIGPDVIATGVLGVLRFSLDKDEDVAAIIGQLRGFADMIEKLKTDYDEVMKQ